MSDLSEYEVLDRMKTSLREAGAAALSLSLSAMNGPTYGTLRTHLLLVEGCCRQIAAMREDSRWLTIGSEMAEAHRRSGKWLRGFKVNGISIKLSASTKHPLFEKLAVNLAFLLAGVENMATARTGTSKPILPETPRAHRRPGAPVAVKLPGETVTPGGIIMSGTIH